MEKRDEVDLQVAHAELIEKLFGRLQGTTDVQELSVTRSTYTKAMKEVQAKHGLRQGHPDFLAWVLTCVGRSPMIIEDEEKGEEAHEPTVE